MRMRTATYQRLQDVLRDNSWHSEAELAQVVRFPGLWVKELAAVLEENRRRLDSLAAALLQHETLDEEDAYAAAGVERRPAPAAHTLATAARSLAD